MIHATPPHANTKIRAVAHVVTIRREDAGYGIRFGLTEAEDEVMRGPIFVTLEEALAWVDEADRARGVYQELAIANVEAHSSL